MRIETRFAASALCLAVLFLSACGEGGSPPSPSSSPPKSTGDFSLSISASSLSTQVGGTTSPVTLSVTGQNGFTGAVSFDLEGFPQGITSSPASPFSVSGGGSQQVTFSAPAAAGTFQIVFVGVSGTQSHMVTLTLTVTPPVQPFLIAATYFPWYVPSSWVYQECYEGTLRGELIPSQLPALGEYNSAQQEVVTQQIAWSSAAGVNVWAMEWVGPNSFLDTTLSGTILTNPHIGDIKFAIFYDYAIRFNGDFNLTQDKINTILSDFTYFSGAYFDNPSYLKVDQGKPVVFLYATRALNPVSSVQAMASSIRQTLSGMGYNVYLIGDEYYALTPPDPVRISIWDGIFGFDTYCGYAGYSDDNGYLALHQTMEGEYQTVAQQLGVDFVPSLTPGFNDRAVRRVCANNPALSRRTNTNASEGSMFQSFLRDIALPLAINSRLKMIHIATFNEWHEDTMIEPSIVTSPTTRDTSRTGAEYTQGLTYQGYGTLYMDIIRNQVAAALGTGQVTRK